MRGLQVVLLAGAAALIPISVWAEPSSSDRTTLVGPIASGPTVSQGSAGFNEQGIQSDSGSRTNQSSNSPAPAPGATSSDLNYVPVGSGAMPGAGSGALLISCPPGQSIYAVYDSTGTFQVAMCTPGASAPAGPNPSPLQLAQEASARQPWPVLQVGINPGTGLTGLASWFWLGGSPQMPAATASAGALMVTVRATLIDIIWDFGDGASLSSGTDLGQAFPAASSIRHTYETDTFGRPEGYLVSAFLRYRVTYSVNGGPFAQLGLKARRYTTSYQVNQLQPQAVSAT